MERAFCVVLLLLFCLGAPFSASRVAAQEDLGSGLAFNRVAEPRENAFTILVPKGWLAEGGIYRVNPLTVGGPINSMEAKCDLVFKSDSRGTVAFHILPDIVYAHAGIGAGYFPVGSAYQGATVRAYEDAPAHLQSLFSALHPNAVSPQTRHISRLPGEIQSMNRGMAYTNQILSAIGLPHQTFQADAAGAVFEYTEGGVRFREVMVCGVVDMRAALTWKNTRTLVFRAPVPDFEKWRPVMDVMRFSIRFSPQWILREAEGQRERADLVLKIYSEIQRIDREIAASTSVNREEIMNDNFLVLTGQEDYVNPRTGEVETDTDAFRYRWTTDGGDIYYTNREDENPNLFLNRSDYQVTPVRKRANE
ncbi:hypothetical protein HQ520_11340 [bacterium]|nr:hypothetical protein [bacterium]